MTNTDKNAHKMEALGRMTRGLVHDMNNSLASVMGYADFLIADLPLGSEQAVFAENIKKSGLQLQELIDQIRALSSEKSKTKDTVLNLVEVSEDLCFHIQAKLGSKQSLSFTSDMDTALLSIPTHQFKTLIRNLIMNAIQALSGKAEGHVAIHMSDMNPEQTDAVLSKYQSVLELERYTPTHMPFITLSITDNGCGMDESLLNMAHAPHFTTHSSDDAHGMGLTIAREIIRYLDGGITIATSVGVGTYIHLTVPVEKAERAIDTTEDDVQKSILLIEDRETVLNTVAQMLQRQNHQVKATQDGMVALDMLREDPESFDILITDYTMPYINGRDLLAEIREDFKHLPVIVMSGDMEYLARLREDYEQNNVFVLHKPISARTLKRVLSSASNRQQIT